MSALRPSSDFKDKTNVNPSVNRQTEATAEDFEEAGNILDDHADRLDELQNELYHANFLGYYTSEALLTSTYPTAPVDSFAIIIDGNNNPTAIFRYYNDTWNEVNATDLILYFATANAFPSPGIPKVWYIAKDTRISYLWYNNQYNIMNPGQQSNNFVTEKYIYPSQLDPAEGNLQQQMVAAINASPQFTIGEFDNMEYLLPVSTTPTDVIEVYIFKHKKGKGVYGTGGTQLTESNIQRGIRTRVRQDIVALGDIGTSTISAYINTDANGPYTEKAFTATINGTFKYYIYNGGAPLIGIGNTQTSEGDYQDMTTEEDVDTSSFATLQNLDETLPYEAKYYLTDIITNIGIENPTEDFLLVETDNAYYFAQKETNVVDFLNCRLILRLNGFKYDLEDTPDLTQDGYKLWQIALSSNVNLTPDNSLVAFSFFRKLASGTGIFSSPDSDEEIDYLSVKTEVTYDPPTEEPNTITFIEEGSQPTGWMSAFLSTGQALTSNVDNLVDFTGATFESDGGLNLIDTDGSITPLQQGDLIIVDFTFSSITPVGIDNFLNVKLGVDGVVFRGYTKRYQLGAGNLDYTSVSWSLPVGVDFFTNGGELYVNPSDAITISNKYLSVSRGHKKRNV